MLPKYENRIVAYIDILGFSTLVQRLENDQELHKRLSYALQRIKHIETIKNAPIETTSTHLEVSVFSDSIALSIVPDDREKLSSLIWVIGYLQAELLYLGILSRGAVASGKTVHADGILYGQGMLNAHKLESQVAIYPRILISSELLTIADFKFLKFWTRKDIDGQTYIDPFRFEAVAHGADELAADGYDPRFCYFEEVYKHLETAIKNTNDANHLQKYSWIGNRYNLAAAKFNETSIYEKCKLLTI